MFNVQTLTDFSENAQLTKYIVEHTYIFFYGFMVKIR